MMPIFCSFNRTQNSEKETQLNEKHIAMFHWQSLIKSQYMKSNDKLTPEYMGSICLSAYIGD